MATMARFSNSSRKRSQSRHDIADLDEAQSQLKKRHRRDTSDTREQTRPPSSSSSLGPDPEEWYGDGDDDAFVQSLRDQFPGTFLDNTPTPWIPRVGRALVGTAQRRGHV